MSARVSKVDEFGVWRIPLPTADSMNTAGGLEVDGDLFACGPCAILRFKLSSDGPDGDGEIDFGSFRVNLAGVGTMHGSCILTEAEAHDLIEALASQVGYPPKSQPTNPAAFVCDVDESGGQA